MTGEQPDLPGVERWVRRLGVGLPVLALVAMVGARLTGAWWPVVAFLVVLVLALAWVVSIEGRETGASFRDALRAQWRRVRGRRA